MRIFVSEYLCSGAWPEPDLPPSLAREGRAMLLALLADVAALPEVTVCTTWDARLGEFPMHAREPRGLSPWPEALATGINPMAQGRCQPPIDCAVVQSPRDESAHFHRLAAECNVTYVIAPELDDLLTQRVQSVLDAGGRSLNAAAAAIAVYSDKRETFRRLSAAGIPTVPTARFVPGEPALPYDFPFVLKPRFGAGSQDTFLIHNVDQLDAAAAHFTSEEQGLSSQRSAASSQKNRKSKIEIPQSESTEAIIQPFMPGRSLSVAAIFRSDGALRELWPLGEQRLTNDGRFTYLGGRIPAPVAPVPWARSPLSALVRQLSSAVPGLRGYVGIDLILPDTPNSLPLIIDVNPRLTTSYLGYRALSQTNLVGRIFWPDRDWPPAEWHDHGVEFDADGAIVRSPAGRR